MTAATDSERLARAALCRVTEPGDDRLGRAIGDHGASDTWASLRDGCWPDGGRAPADVLVRVRSAAPEADLAALDRVGGRLVLPDDDEWPDRLVDLAGLSGGGRQGAAAPIALWVRGPLDLRMACLRAASVVGSRAATGYGNHVAGELGAGLAERRCTVVSGGAYGIDGAAHRGALVVEGPTVAVLACGVDVAYPRAHEALLARIAREGLLVSEWPPGCAPMRHRFLTRNRVIAALTLGTVVVEAAARSGALSTARIARDLGRELMAVPGPVTSVMSVGCHALLREPAVTLVTTAAEVLESVGRIGADLAPLPRGPEFDRDRLSGRARRVLDAVPATRGSGPARIAVIAGVEVLEVLRHLGELRANGFVEQVDTGWRLTRDARSNRPVPVAGGSRHVQEVLDVDP